MRRAAAVPEIRTMKLSALKAAEYNPRTITAKAAKGLQASIRRFGLVQPIVWNKRSKRVVGGHQRIDALRKLEKAEAQVLVVDLPEVEEKALNVTLNNPAIEGEFSKAVSDVIASLRGALPKMDFSDLLLGEVDPNKPEIVEDEVPEPPNVAVTKPGDLWTLGRHRLLCGDATEDTEADRLFAGRKADVIFTDPPYGVNVTGKGGKAIAGDISFTAIPLMFAQIDRALGPSGWCYVCGGQSNLLLYAKMFERSFRQLVRLIVWDKGRTAVMRHNGYHSSYELIYYAFREGGGATWHGPRDSDHADDVWRIQVKDETDREHPTQKPARLPARAIGNSCPPDGVVADFFLGAGSTLIAAEQLDRICFGLEIEPRYCDVVVERWQNLTGQKATRA